MSDAALSALAPDMPQVCYGRVLRPPRLDWNGHEYTGMHLAWHDALSLADLPGIIKLVVRRDFVGVVAREDRYAMQAIAQLRVRWKAHDAAPQSLPAEPQRDAVYTQGDVAGALSSLSAITERSYGWTTSANLPDADSPLLTAMADLGVGGARLWTAAPLSLEARQQIAMLMGVPVALLRADVAMPGRQYLAGELSVAERSMLQDAAADAALLAAAAGVPVCLSLLPEQVSIAAPRLLAQVAAAIDGAVHAYRHTVHAVDIGRPPLALMLSGTPDPVTEVASDLPLWYRAQLPPYAYPALELARHGVIADDGQALAAHVFAHESFIDEAARMSDADPLQFRLQHIQDARGAALLREVARQAGWPVAAKEGKRGDKVLRGRGVSYARVIDGDGALDAARHQWSVWVVDVAYDRASGDLDVTRVVVGQDVAEAGSGNAGQAGSLPQIEDESASADVQLTMRSLLASEDSFDTWGQQACSVALQDKPGAALLAQSNAGLPGPVQLRSNAAFALPAAAAVANAIHDATGIRLRSAPFSSEQLRLALGDKAISKPRAVSWKSAIFGGVAATLAGLFVMAWPWRTEIKPVGAPDPSLYSAATIARGKLVAAAGDCMVCHTAPGGKENSGGHALETPFGTVYSTNITPDVNTGIGNWSFAAFERAMREGIHRDGRHLYPAFPYTAFAKISDADMQALYAYLMAQEPVSSTPPQTSLAFPFNVRPLMAGWNLLFHNQQQFVPDLARSAQWNRGAYLVEGAGHCSACHSPRNMFGAEKGGRAYLTGGTADGWDAPALTSLSQAPVPWSEAELFSYLRTGFSPLHGVAAGPMAPVVAELAQLPADDVRAIAHYLASFNQTPATVKPESSPAREKSAVTLAVVAAATAPAVAAASADGRPPQTLVSAMGENLYRGSCAVCHQGGTGPTLFGVKPSLALNTNVFSANPDNLIRVILHGIREPANSELGYMPGFADSFNDEQMVELLQYLRASFAADQPAWPNLKADVARIRASSKVAQPH